MAEHRPIYSAQAAGQQIGYIEDDEAFDLFDSACAVYESNTGLLRDPRNNAVVGYVSLADIFVGSSWMAQELFSKTRPIAPRASLEELEDGHSDAPVCGAEDCDAENVDGVRIIAQVQSHHAAKTGLFVASTPVIRKLRQKSMRRMQPTSQLSQALPNRIKWSARSYRHLRISGIFDRAISATSRRFRCQQTFSIMGAWIRLPEPSHG